MDSPSSIVRRRAWINSSRQWPTLEEPEGPSSRFLSASVADDDVFSDGCFTGKIENWLLGCGSEICPENTSRLSFESALKTNNCDDDLSLGADASVVRGGDISCEAGRAPHPSLKRHSSSTSRPGLSLPSLSLGISMASSCLSSSTCKTTSSVSEVLQMCSEDAEETLFELGFGSDEPQVHVRIPPRFFTFPSQAQGINFRLFLDSQLRRIREEDPSLSLASRFRQVQVLTAMANAFYSLYSHVSRTPLQKLATPEFTFSSSMERIERFRSSIRSEPRSPVERLKDTVSKMCLYTGSPRGSDSTSPQPSPRKRSSLPDVVDLLLVKAKTGGGKKLDFEEYKRSSVSQLGSNDGKSCNRGEEEITHPNMEDTGNLQHANKGMHSSKHSADAAENIIHRTHNESRTSVDSSVSGETVIQPSDHFFSCHDTNSPQSDTRTTAEIKPVARVTHDLICPQIAEKVHQASFCTQHTDTDTSCASKNKPHIQVPISCSGDITSTAESRSLPVLAQSGTYTHYCITVTGWEGDNTSASLLNTRDSSNTLSLPPVHAGEEPLNEGKTSYLTPVTPQGLGFLSNNLQQVNSFELEEVHSAGEEDLSQSDTTTTSPLSTKHQNKGEVTRGDSVQSDSSGYADEEVSSSSDRHGK
ncbi:TESPA1 [Solea senegalensis]|uniref:TESPA1 n=1 Tax=Solea senegalensis TaxID=28829 RepID=A0AAV6QMT3_SOLSE|nr:protein TESPA1 [Solea senegalensis]KAG7493539.1 TESPA1 [Solea senegalensis]